MPEAADISGEVEETKGKDKPKEEKDVKVKKSATTNGLLSFSKGKLVLARINLLDGTVQDFSIEVGVSYCLRVLVNSPPFCSAGSRQFPAIAILFNCLYSVNFHFVSRNMRICSTTVVNTVNFLRLERGERSRIDRQSVRACGPGGERLLRNRVHGPREHPQLAGCR